MTTVNTRCGAEAKFTTPSGTTISMAAKQKGLALLSGLNHLTGDWEGFLWVFNHGRELHLISIVSQNQYHLSQIPRRTFFRTQV